MGRVRPGDPRPVLRGLAVPQGGGDPHAAPHREHGHAHRARNPLGLRVLRVGAAPHGGAVLRQRGHHHRLHPPRPVPGGAGEGPCVGGDHEAARARRQGRPRRAGWKGDARAGRRGEGRVACPREARGADSGRRPRARRLRRDRRVDADGGVHAGRGGRGRHGGRGDVQHRRDALDRGDARRRRHRARPDRAPRRRGPGIEGPDRAARRPRRRDLRTGRPRARRRHRGRMVREHRRRPGGARPGRRRADHRVSVRPRSGDPGGRHGRNGPRRRARHPDRRRRRAGAIAVRRRGRVRQDRNPDRGTDASSGRQAGTSERSPSRPRPRPAASIRSPPRSSTARAIEGWSSPQPQTSARSRGEGSMHRWRAPRCWSAAAGSSRRPGCACRPRS